MSLTAAKHTNALRGKPKRESSITSDCCHYRMTLKKAHSWSRAKYILAGQGNHASFKAECFAAH